jgi:ethanolaminephosphotransferase
MPRVKAITTGSVPSFLDVILNFSESDTTSTLANVDNWLAQIRANNGSLLMFGDDTWLKLFPDMFTRADGTSSFFVSVSWSFLASAQVELNSEFDRILPKLIVM